MIFTCNSIQSCNSEDDDYLKFSFFPPSSLLWSGRLRCCCCFRIMAREAASDLGAVVLVLLAVVAGRPYRQIDDVAK
jgi:hypothetical protein